MNNSTASTAATTDTGDKTPDTPKDAPKANAEAETNTKTEDEAPTHGFTDAQSAEIKAQIDKAVKAAVTETNTEWQTRIAALTGQTSKDEPPTVDDLAKQLDAKDAANTLLAIQNTVLRVAPGIGNADMLLDSQRFTETLKGIDPTDVKAVKDAVTEFVKEHPAYAEAPKTPAGPSAVDTKRSKDAPPADLATAISAYYNK